MSTPAISSVIVHSCIIYTCNFSVSDSIFNYGMSVSPTVVESGTGSIHIDSLLGAGCITQVSVSGSQAGTQEEAVSKAKQSRSEKKARKALSKLGLQRPFFISAQYISTFTGEVGLKVKCAIPDTPRGV